MYCWDKKLRGAPVGMPCLRIGSNMFRKRFLNSCTSYTSSGRREGGGGINMEEQEEKGSEGEGKIEGGMKKGMVGERE